jgi:hypothetical protein
MSTIPTPPNGSAISSPQDTSPEAMSMSDQSSMFDLTSYGPIVNATSSQASADGHTPCDSPDGPTTDLFGQEVVPASLSASQARARQPMTADISGLNGSGLSALYDQQSSLANKLKQQLDGAGSILFTLTWELKATPLGLPYFQLVASGRRTSDNDFGSWQTPTQVDSKDRRYTYSRGQKDHPFITLPGQAQMASWPTPNAGPQNGGDTTWQMRRKAMQAKYGNNGFGMTLGQASQLTSWPTPAATDDKHAASGQTEWLSNRGKKGIRLNDHVVHRGPIATGSPAQTEKRGRLNPEFSRWLMGYPAQWDACAPTVTRSSRRLPQNL